MNKQTAVEWLQEQQKELLNQVKSGEFKIEDFAYYNTLYIEQAKQMEKEQSHNYAEFAIRCDRIEMKILNFEDWIKF